MTTQAVDLTSSPCSPTSTTAPATCPPGGCSTGSRQARSQRELAAGEPPCDPDAGHYDPALHRPCATFAELHGVSEDPE